MTAAIAFVSMLAVVPAYGQMLKCVGKDGKVEYASQCPPGSKESQTGIKNNPGSPTPSAAPKQKSMAEREAEFKKRQAEQAEHHCAKDVALHHARSGGYRYLLTTSRR